MTMPQAVAFIALAVLNIVAFFVVFSDKRKAIRGRWRTPERAFLLLSLFGGGAGVLVGFFVCHHKTKHRKLLAGTLLLACIGYLVLYQLANIVGLLHAPLTFS